MFQQEAMRDGWNGETFGSSGVMRGEETFPERLAGEKLVREASGQAPTAVQRLVLALISLGMLMGMSTLLTILTTRSPGWVAVLLLFVLTLFTAAVVSINVVFSQRRW
jgi:hypothetical protein